MLKSSLLILLLSLSYTIELPELNAKIITYIDSVMDKKVARGECWDLAAGALAYSGAYFDRSSQKTVTIYGRKLNPKNEEVLPGDLIQFENVQMKWSVGNTTYSSAMAQHTAIVYKVNAKGDFEIAHQNTSEWGKKVGVSNFNLNHVTKGKVMIYRPIKNKK
ncbi:MAG: CHAP domain-containing protein [Reichenbachiella sp.]|uniref:CHAP domain-containing protein n=1 Tax=Reichenbachiella sp. TaxID=2184521 RepID=UPI003266256E